MKLFSKNSYEFSIFLFHGVISNNPFDIRNYNNKHLNKDKFVKFLKYIKSVGNCISVEDLFYFKKKILKLKKNTFLITFDDGFENNYSIAAPILDDLKMFSTFYFSTDFIENNSMSWIDQIEHLVENTTLKKIILSIPKKIEFDISTKKKKIIFLDYLRYIVKKDLSFDVSKLILLLSEKLKVKNITSSNSPIDKKISWKNIKKMQSNNLFSIGGHSHEHFSLSSFKNDGFKYQINKSKSLFKKKMNHDLVHYSYPEGQKIDFNRKIIDYLKYKKIICCPTAQYGFNTLRTNLFKLKRISIT